MKLRVYAITFIILIIFCIFLIHPIEIYIKNYIGWNKLLWNNNFWNDIGSSFYAALFFTLFLFYIKEVFFQERDISGTWNLEADVLLSTTIPGYKLGYRIFILKKGSEIIGEGEKIYEIDKSSISKEFHPRNQSKIVSINIDGHVGRRYLRGDVVSLLIREKGTKRESLMIIKLRFKNKNELFGTFSSTAATSVGNIRLTKEEI